MIATGSVRSVSSASIATYLWKPMPYLVRFKAALVTLRARQRYRSHLRHLLEVGPHMIEDVGLDLAEVRREIEKPVWRA